MLGDFSKEIEDMQQQISDLKRRNKILRIEMYPYRVWIWSMMIVATYLAYTYIPK